MNEPFGDDPIDYGYNFDALFIFPPLFFVYFRRKIKSSNIPYNFVCFSLLYSNGIQFNLFGRKTSVFKLKNWHAVYYNETDINPV